MCPTTTDSKPKMLKVLNSAGVIKEIPEDEKDLLRILEGSGCTILKPGVVHPAMFANTNEEPIAPEPPSFVYYPPFDELLRRANDDVEDAEEIWIIAQGTQGYSAFTRDDADECWTYYNKRKVWLKEQETTRGNND